MTTTPPSHDAPARHGNDWLEHWDPEAADWDKKRAWTTLWVSTFSLTLAFIAWFLVSALAPVLNDIGFDLSKGQLYWLAAIPGLSGGLLRLVWTFLPPVIGTRKLVTLTTALLLIPFIGWALAVQNPDTPYAVLLMLGVFAGIGGGAFSGFMPSTSYFFPRAKQGTALGIQAGVGNFGVSVVQLATPWIIGFMLLGGAFATAVGAPQRIVNDEGVARDVFYQNAGYAWVPMVIIGVILSWVLLRSVPVKVARKRDQFDIFRNKHTWVMTILYVITFGTFSGFAAIFGLLIKNVYGSDVFGADGISPLKYAFLGALVGSAARIFAGPIADKVGGSRVTLVSSAGIAVSSVYTSFQLDPASAADFPKFLGGMLAIFLFAGIGNASTFKQMPVIFERRQAGGVIGFTSAIAAFGPFYFGIALASFSPEPLFWAWALLATVGVGITWWYYARKGAEKPS